MCFDIAFELIYAFRPTSLGGEIALIFIIQKIDMWFINTRASTIREVYSGLLRAFSKTSNLVRLLKTVTN
ncbi:hypothetical protein C8P68_101389 [Mucilaginibacter yixingensis]|uniref:Uncharacterized protein n=1 Tax=Mucilaginibacter yixingensis TaxID=1295612 RepID=A0A2T5JFM6_9SPHI|nr:hypothetical protein C8P68_101389 [Mucilaginibacter yixingensis]